VSSPPAEESIALGFVVIFFLPPTPETARFGFTKEEKECIIRRSRATHNTEDAKLYPKLIFSCFIDVHFWLFVGMAGAGHYCYGTIGMFLPSIIEGFGYSTVGTQLMSVLVYFCAFVGIIFWARVVDKTNRRGVTLAASSVVSVVGYALLVGVKNNNRTRFAATCILAFGAYPNTVLVLTWLAVSITGYTKRSVEEYLPLPLD